MLLGMVTHPYFAEQTIAKSRHHRQEIKMYDDSPTGGSSPVCSSACTTSIPSAAISRARWSIAEITPEMLYDSGKAFYAPGNMVLGCRQHYHGADLWLPVSATA